MLLSVAFAREPFPRSEGRGSIEALATVKVLAHCRFPRSEGRGSIEARLGRVVWAACGPVSTFGRTWLH